MSAMRTTFTFRSAGQLVVGPHALRELAPTLDRLGSKRVFLVADPILAKVGIVEQVQAAAGRSLEVFDGGEPEPSLEMIHRCIEAAKTFRPDTIIGLGGGSNMDAAKLAAVVLGHGGDPRDYVGENKVPGPIMPLVCIPTTAGTGSEVSQAAVFTNTDIHLKVSVLSYYLRPAAALVDSMLTVSCPAKVTADSGIDALTHAIEGYTAVDNAIYPLPAGETSVYQGKNPMADMCAAKAITLVGQYLRRAVADGDDLEAREGMALAGTLGGLAFSNAGVALVHAMEYPVGATVHCSHGAGNGLLLPYVMRYNQAGREKEFAEIGHLLGVGATKTDAEGTAAALKEIEQLRADIGIPNRLRDIGVKETMLAEFAEKAFSFKRLMRVNPRHPHAASEIEEVYRQAW
jgi:alcohol dehydrogenase class IV